MQKRTINIFSLSERLYVALYSRRIHVVHWPFRNTVISLSYDYGSSQRHLVMFSNHAFFKKKKRKRNYLIWRNIPFEIRVRAGFSLAFPEVREIFGVRRIFVIYSNGQNSGASRGRYFTWNYKLSCTSAEIVR